MDQLLERYIKKIETIKKGTYFNLEYVTKPKLPAKFKNQELLKITKGVFRKIGVEYSNLIENKNKVTGELPWGSWVPGYEGYFIQHKEKGKDVIKYFLRVYPTKNHKPQVKYLLNNVPVKKEWLIENGYIKESKPKICFDISLNGIMAL